MTQTKIIFISLFLMMPAAFAQDVKDNPADSLSAPLDSTTLAVDTLSTEVDIISQTIAQAAAGDAKAQNQLGYWYYTGYDRIDKNYDEAFKWFVKSAEQGYNIGQMNLGICYQLGRGVAADSLASCVLYKTALKGGATEVVRMHDKLAHDSQSIFSSLLLADIYRNGVGVRRSLTKSEEYIQMAATYGHVESMFSCGRSDYASKNYTSAAEWFRKAALHGHPASEYLYGSMLFNGEGIANDRVTGMVYLEKSAESGNYMANADLGRIYLEGDSVAKDPSRAVGYLKKAAFRHKASAFLLGKCYKDGIGVEKDFYLAVQWMSESQDDGKASRELISNMLADDHEGNFTKYLRGLYRYYIDENYDAAYDYFTKVDNYGEAEGATMSALCMSQPSCSKYNPSKAFQAMEKASLKSNIAKYYLSQFYSDGIGTDKDIQKSLELLSSASDAGMAPAQCEMGDKYMEGIVVSQDLNKAAALYLLAEHQHRLNPSSSKNLARCYEIGLKTLPDLDNAEERIKALNSQKTDINLNLFLSRAF